MTRQKQSHSTEKQMDLSPYLYKQLIQVRLAISSQKKLLEHFAQEISGLLLSVERKQVDEPIPNKEQIFTALHNRERLGSTALGNGIALPHGRVDKLLHPVIAVVTLQHPLDYDAPDNTPIWLAVCLLAPEERNQTHLNLLAELANKFSDMAFCNTIKKAVDVQNVYHQFLN